MATCCPQAAEKALAATQQELESVVQASKASALAFDERLLELQQQLQDARAQVRFNDPLCTPTNTIITCPTRVGTQPIISVPQHVHSAMCIL